jgi:hypothetical protein
MDLFNLYSEAQAFEENSPIKIMVIVRDHQQSPILVSRYRLSTFRYFEYYIGQEHLQNTIDRLRANPRYEADTEVFAGLKFWFSEQEAFDWTSLSVTSTVV